MRKILLSVVTLLFVTNIIAQAPKQPAASALFAEKLSRISNSFRDNYYGIQGEQLSSQDDIDMYSSLVLIPGAKHCVIFRFHSKYDTSASWQAIMYEGDDYKEALKIYKNNCKLVNRCKVNLPGGAALFAGKVENPNPDLRFVSSVFSLNTKDAVYKNFYAEVEMVGLTLDKWEVRLNLHSKRDDAGDDGEDE